jgi:hypothetical protein
MAVSACGQSSITASRLEPAIETTFANLVELQVARMRLPPMSAPDFAVTAICRKQLPGSEAGSGEWTCTLVWQGPDRRTLRDTFDLHVNTDGCYSATVSGEGLGGPSCKRPTAVGSKTCSTRLKAASIRPDKILRNPITQAVLRACGIRTATGSHERPSRQALRTLRA